MKLLDLLLTLLAELSRAMFPLCMIAPVRTPAPVRAERACETATPVHVPLRAPY